MAIIRWNPRSLSSFLDDDWEFPTFPGINRLGQGLNLYETKDQLIAEAAMPGVNEDDIDITVDDNIVRITATSKSQPEDKSARRYYMSSMSSSYNYSFRLPEGLSEDKEPEAELNNGILTLTFQKIEKTPPKKVKIGSKAKEATK